MNVEAAIHEHWNNWRPLCELAPIERVSTGLAHASRRPFVTLHRLDGAQFARTSSGALLMLAPIEFRVHDLRLDAAQRLAAAIVARFNRAEFALGGVRVLDCLPTGQNQSPSDDGAWRVDVRFLLRAEQRE